MDLLRPALELLDAMDQALGQADADPLPLRIDPEALEAWSARRAQLLEQLQQLDRQVGAAVSAAAAAVGAEPSVAALARHSPERFEELQGRAAAVRAHAAALRQTDELRARALRRAQGVVRGYLLALAPPSQAYDRGGVVKPQVLGGSVETRA